MRVEPREPFIHHHVIDKLAFVAGVISGIDIVPQVYDIIVHQSVANVSFTMYSLVFLNNIVWLVYAIHRGLVSVGLAAILNIVSAGIVLWYFAIL